MDIDGDAAAIVDHAHSAVRQDRDRNRVAIPGHRLVDGVVDNFLDKVVQPARTSGADVHARALAHRLKTLEDLDFICPVFGAIVTLGIVLTHMKFGLQTVVGRPVHPIKPGASRADTRRSGEGKVCSMT